MRNATAPFLLILDKDYDYLTAGRRYIAKLPRDGVKRGSFIRVGREDDPDTGTFLHGWQWQQMLAARGVTVEAL